MKKIKFIKLCVSEENISEDLSYSRFIIKNLEPFYGVTIGNSLRRILLSSLPGNGIVYVHIEGVDHEFSTIPGIYEDVMSIVLNLKKIVIAVDSDDEDFEQKLELFAQGKQQVTADFFQQIEGVRIINPEQIIANLVSDNVSLKLAILIKRGIGYANAEENKIYTKNKLGLIAMDTWYTPIVKVTYEIEKKMSDKEDLSIDITTNKSITSKTALTMAAKILVDHFNFLVNLQEKTQKMSFISEPKKDISKNILDLRIDQLDLSVRLFNCLKKSNINTLAELILLKEKEVFKLKSLGKKSFHEIKEKLNQYGLKFKNDLNKQLDNENYE